MITLYSKDNCPQCETAKTLVKSKGLEYTVKKLGVDYTREELLTLAPTARTVPQIFLDGSLIGGVPELQKYLANY